MNNNDEAKCLVQSLIQEVSRDSHTITMLEVQGVREALEGIHVYGEEHKDMKFAIYGAFCLGVMLSDRMCQLNKIMEGSAVPL